MTTAPTLTRCNNCDKQVFALPDGKPAPHDMWTAGRWRPCPRDNVWRTHD
jgi:hypothetical protein